MNQNNHRNRRSRFNQEPFPTPHYSSPSLYNYTSSNRQDPRTPEQIAFEIEFTKWETGFEEWKRSYANHPDRSAYFQYEKKFLDVREKLVQKRSQIYSSQHCLKNQLDSQLVAASRMADNILSKFGVSSGPRSGPSNSYRVNQQQYGSHVQAPPSAPPFRSNSKRARDASDSFSRFKQSSTQISGPNPKANKRQRPNKSSYKNETGLKQELSRNDVYPNIPW